MEVAGAVVAEGRRAAALRQVPPPGGLAHAEIAISHISHGEMHARAQSVGLARWFGLGLGF